MMVGGEAAGEDSLVGLDGFGSIGFGLGERPGVEGDAACMHKCPVAQLLLLVARPRPMSGTLYRQNLLIVVDCGCCWMRGRCGSYLPARRQAATFGRRGRFITGLFQGFRVWK